MKITKLDAATRQFSTALHLYFDDRDPVSTHTLLHAANEIFDRLCEAKGEKGMRATFMDSFKNERKKKVHDALNEAANFFNHASPKKPDLEFEFDDDMNMIGLMQATHAMQKLGVESTLARAFFGWVAVACPDLLETPPDKAPIEQLFGRVWERPRSEQKKMGKGLLELVLAGKLRP